MLETQTRSRAWRRLDWQLCAVAAALVTWGSLAVISAASPLPYYSQILERHFLALALGVLLFFMGAGLNYQIFQDQARIIYALVIAIMVCVLLVGVTRRGHRSWLNLALFSFQPVEFARIGLTLVLANYLDRRSRNIEDIATVAGTIAIALPVAVLILKQPDFASMLTLLPLVMGLLFCAGASLIQLSFLAGCIVISLAYPLIHTLCQIHVSQAAAGSFSRLVLETSKMQTTAFFVVGGILVASFLVWRLTVMMHLRLQPKLFIAVPMVLIFGLAMGVFINKHLKGYQRNRFVAFVAPEVDAQGASYNVNQSRIAIGSGGLWGKGLFSGTQGQLGFLPERHTDFVYAVIGEESGFFGAIAVLLLYLVLIWRIVVAARLSRDRYGYLLCCGLASIFGFQLVLNVGMCVGFVPVAGVPLPLISYGGSSLAVSLWALGIVSNVYARRYSFA